MQVHVDGGNMEHHAWREDFFLSWLGAEQILNRDEGLELFLHVC